MIPSLAASENFHPSEGSRLSVFEGDASALQEIYVSLRIPVKDGNATPKFINLESTFLRRSPILKSKKLTMNDDGHWTCSYITSIASNSPSLIPSNIKTNAGKLIYYAKSAKNFLIMY